MDSKLDWSEGRIKVKENELDLVSATIIKCFLCLRRGVTEWLSKVWKNFNLQLCVNVSLRQMYDRRGQV